MKGAAASAKPNAKQHKLQKPKPSLLKKGSLVEVSSDEEGFKGAWYLATLLHLPSPPTFGAGSASASKRRNSHLLQAYVEYHSLLAEEGSSEPLREYVNPEFVRPLPPTETSLKPFELGDLVDAFFRDGWWTGVITGVLLPGLRFVVTFQNPPDEIDFGISELRFHREWVNRKWVRPAKLRATELMFSVGKRVEVSFDLEDCCDAWFPATILEDIGNGRYRVEYGSGDKGGDAKRMKKIVDLLHIRPCPPCLKDNVFCLLKKVDASFDFGWWSGVITKELTDCRYIVYFKSTNKDKEFDHTELRPHMEWKDGNWFTSSQDILKPPDYERHEGHVYNNFNDTSFTLPLSNSGFKENTTTEKKILALNLNQVDIAPCDEEAPRVTSSLKGRALDSPLLSDDREILKEVAPTTLSPTVVNPMSSDTIVSVDKTKIFEYASPSPENTGNNLSNRYLDEDPSDSRSWGKRVKRKRIKLYEDETLGSRKTSGSAKKSLVKRSSNSVGGRDVDALGDAGEGVHEECITTQTNLPVVLGLECDKGSNSTSRKPYDSSGEELLSMGIPGGLNDNEPYVIKDGDELDSQEKLKKRRGRPRKVEIKSSITSPSGEPSKDAMADELLVKDFITRDNDSLKDVEIKSGNIDFSVGSQEFVINGSSKKHVSEQEKHKSKDNIPALSQLRKLSEATVEVPIKQQERHSTKRVRRRTINVNIVSQVQDSLHAASVGKTAESNCMVKEVEITTEEFPIKTLEDQPLLKWLNEMHAPTTSGASRVSPTRNIEQSAVASNGQVIETVMDSVGVDKTKMVGEELESLPFVKNTLLWSTLETMEVFRKLPQKPHFRPLKQYKESSREGLAIGYMVNFSSVVERSTKLQFDDPKSVIDDIMETLLELECHGFEVRSIRDCITDLLNMKEGKEKLEEQLEEVGGEIEKHKNEKDKIDEAMEEIKKQILVLEEKLGEAKLAKERKEVGIVSLQSKVEGIKEGMGRMESDFQRLAASLM